MKFQGSSRTEGSQSPGSWGGRASKELHVKAQVKHLDLLGSHHIPATLLQ